MLYDERKNISFVKVVFLFVNLTRAQNTCLHGKSINENIKLSGLSSNGSHLLVNQHYPAIKCECHNYNCTLYKSEEGSHTFNLVENVIFTKEGTEILYCLDKNDLYCSAIWNVHIGKIANITLFQQISNFEVSCSINKNKRRNLSIFFDNKPIMTSNDSNEEELKFNLSSIGDFRPEDYDTKVITCESKNEWGTDKRQLLLNITHDPIIKINGQSEEEMEVKVDTNISCTFRSGNPRPESIVLLFEGNAVNSSITEKQGIFNVTCRVKLINGKSLEKKFNLKVIRDDVQLFYILASICGGVISVIGLILCYKNYSRKTQKPPDKIIQRKRLKEDTTADGENQVIYNTVIYIDTKNVHNKNVIKQNKFQTPEEKVYYSEMID